MEVKGTLLRIDNWQFVTHNRKSKMGCNGNKLLIAWQFKLNDTLYRVYCVLISIIGFDCIDFIRIFPALQGDMGLASYLPHYDENMMLQHEQQDESSASG